MWYLLIIMVLSLGCSLALYHVSLVDLQNNAHRQMGYFNNLLEPGDLRGYARIRDNQLTQDRNHLKGSLIFFNLMVLLAGGVVSYGLARRTMEPIEEALEAQKRFTGDASHELRTPLAVMQSEIEVALRSKSLSKERAVALLHSNLEEVGKLKTLSDGLLRLASENAKNLVTETVPLNQVVKEAVDRQAKTAKGKNITIKQDITDSNLKGDPQSLTELISLILDNAIKYSPEGTQVSIESKKKSRHAVIIISDQGQGIKASDLPHIFDRFYRADTSRTKNNVDGYGLGLAIAKKITDLHGGTITAKSKIGKGSVFTIQIPLA
jgi:two-component system, OmpR family, sensor histidine kinase CiaH